MTASLYNPPDDAVRAFYPELLRNDVLGFHVNEALSAIGSSVASDPRGSVGGDGQRRAIVFVAAAERRFRADLSQGGTSLGSYSNPDLVEVARVIDAWCRSEPTSLSVPEIVTKFPGTSFEPQVFGSDDGPAVYTQRAWKAVLGRLKDEASFLYPAAALAFEQPQLAEMFPFTTHIRLRFTTLIGRPRPFNMPIVSARGDDYFSVENLLHSGLTLGYGTAREAIAIVLANMPPGCGPARHEE